MYQYRYKSIITYNNTLCLPCYRRENTQWLSLWTVPRGSGRRWSHCWATWLRVRPPTLTWSSCSPSYSAWWRNTPPFWWAVYSKQCCGYEFYLECRFWILPTLVEHFWKLKKTCNQLKRRIYQLFVMEIYFICSFFHAGSGKREKEQRFPDPGKVSDPAGSGFTSLLPLLIDLHCCFYREPLAPKLFFWNSVF